VSCALIPEGQSSIMVIAAPKNNLFIFSMLILLFDVTKVQ